MIIPLNIPADKLIAVYTLHITQFEGAVWIGIALASDVWSLSDTRKNPPLRQLIEQDGNPRITIKLLTGDIHEAKNYASRLHHETPSAAAAIADTNPVIPGRRVRRGDGTVYASAREAARANGANHGNMSKHLNRKPGYQTVGGHFFEWLP